MFLTAFNPFRLNVGLGVGLNTDRNIFAQNIFTQNIFSKLRIAALLVLALGLLASCSSNTASDAEMNALDALAEQALSEVVDAPTAQKAKTAQEVVDQMDLDPTDGGLCFRGHKNEFFNRCSRTVVLTACLSERCNNYIMEPFEDYVIEEQYDSLHAHWEPSKPRAEKQVAKLSAPLSAKAQSVKTQPVAQPETKKQESKLVDIKLKEDVSANIPQEDPFSTDFSDLDADFNDPFFD